MLKEHNVRTLRANEVLGIGKEAIEYAHDDIIDDCDGFEGQSQRWVN